MIHIEPPSVFQNALHWGVHHQLTIPFKKSTVYSSFPINKSEIIAITSNSIFRLEKTTIKESAPLRLSTATFIEKQNVIVGVSSTTSEFFFIRPYDLTHHIETNVRTKQVPTFHILYSPKSSLLITSGKNIKIWNLKLMMPTRNAVSVPPVIEITLRNVLNSSFEADLLNPPLFNYQQELLIIPESTGFNAYNMDCQFVKQMTKLSTSTRTSAAISNETGNLITFESSEGASYEWNTNGTLLRRNIIGSSSVVSCRYINSNFVIYLDAKNNIYLYDILTMKFFLCDQLNEKPSSLLLYYTTASFFPIISVCYDNSIDFYEIVIPWKLWRSTMPKPHLIQICRRHGRASRLLVHTDSEYIYFISPKTQQTVTSSTPSTPSKILSTYYDRGLNSGQQRDQLFTITYDEKLTISSTSTVPCSEITSIDTNIASVFECNIENHHYYAVATSTGEIIVHDYDTFEPVKRYIIVVDKLLCAKYDDKFSTVLMFYEHEIIRVEVATGNVVSSLSLKTVPEIGTVFDFKDELALIGYKSGRISMINVTEREMKNMANNGCVFHTMEVTGFSISTNFFISVSADQQMKLWSFSGSNILTITLPLPLYAVEVINGKRDIVVGTEKDIMIIEGRTLFCEKFEPKNDDIDNYNEKNDILSDDSASSLYLLEQQKKLLRSTWKDNEEQQQPAKKMPLYVKKKKEMDDETRRKILEKMMKMGDDPFTLKRIAEREKRRFEDQKNRIQSEVDKERKKREEEKEEEERRKAREEEIKKLIQKQKEELENQKKKEQQQEQQQLEDNQIENDDQNELNSQKEEEEDDDENDHKNNNLEDNQNEPNNTDPTFFKFYSTLLNNDDQKPSETAKPPKKKKKKKTNKNDSKNKVNKTNVVYVDENGNKFRMLDNGDWVDENGKVYHKKSDGTFVANDGSVFNPDKNKGHFETADGGQIDGEFAPEGTIWTSPDGKQYRSLGDGRWIGPDGQIYTIGKNGAFISADGNVADQIMPEKWIGPDGKVYYRQADGSYVAEDGTVWDKPMDGSAGGYFASIDGSKPGDTFVDENGNVYTRTSEGWVGPDGKLYRIGKDGQIAFDMSKGQLFHQDGYNPDDIYVAPDGTVYKRTPSNRGWIGPDGKIYRLNKDGVFVADDGSVLPLSNERLVWVEKSGVAYRPTYKERSWISSDGGRVYEYEMVDKGEQQNDQNRTFSTHRFVSSDGSIWSGPTANQGRFSGKDLFDSPIQWIDFYGRVFKAVSADGRVWTTTSNGGRLFERQENGLFIEKVDSDDRMSWEGPGKPCDGNWVNSKGQIIESLGGYWISPDKKIYTATKGGYISITGVLYKPTTRSEAFVSKDGERWNGLGQIISPDVNGNGCWIEANGDVYRPIDKSGNWEGPNGEIYSPQPDGTWVCQSSSKIWKGPPFISARKYFLNNYWMQSFHLPSWPPVPFMPFHIGERPNTPLYKVPPLLYPPFKSRFKAFKTRSPMRKRAPVVYRVPPPNIVVDPSQVVKLINDGNTQLIEVAKRLGLGNGMEKSYEAPSSRASPSLPQLVKRFEYIDREEDRINVSASLPSYPQQQKMTNYETFERSFISKSPSQIQPPNRQPPLPPIQRPTQNQQQDSTSYVTPRTQFSSNINKRLPLIPSDHQNSYSNVGQSLNSSESISQLSPRTQFSGNMKKRLPLIPSDQYNDHQDSYSNVGQSLNSSESIRQVSPRTQFSNNMKKRLPLIQDDQHNEHQNASPKVGQRIRSNASIGQASPRTQCSSNMRKRVPLIPYDSRDTVVEDSADVSFPNNGRKTSLNTAEMRNLANKDVESARLEAKRVDGFGEKFDHPVPLLSFAQNKETPLTAVPKTERQPKRRLCTAYLCRSYKIQLEKPQNQTSREIVNPLIVKSMVKPKISIPQQLFKPKRNY